MIIDYDELTRQFEHSLLHTLRGHGAGLDLLETWVPDDDPVKGILNMVEAAQLAGQDAILIQVALETLPPARHQELKEILKTVGPVSLSRDGEALIVAVGGPDPEQEFAEVSADLAAGLRRVFAEMAHDGPLPAADADAQLISSEGDGAVVSLLIEREAPHRVRAARHRGGRDAVERAALDAVCAMAEGVPLLDAADHAAIRALHMLRGRQAARPVAGILQPSNAHPALDLGERLLRSVRAAFLREVSAGPSDYNDYEAPPGQAWLDQAPALRLERLGGEIAQALARAGRPASDIGLVGLEDDLHGCPVRVMINFASTVEAGDKPELMRQLEMWLKDRLEPSLQLYHEPEKDRNVIRRL